MKFRLPATWRLLRYYQIVVYGKSLCIERFDPPTCSCANHSVDNWCLWEHKRYRQRAVFCRQLSRVLKTSDLSYLLQGLCVLCVLPVYSSALSQLHTSALININYLDLWLARLWDRSRIVAEWRVLGKRDVSGRFLLDIQSSIPGEKRNFLLTLSSLLTRVWTTSESIALGYEIDNASLSVVEVKNGRSFV